MTELRGSCHCGNLVLRVSLSKPLDSFESRICSCSFCQKHAAAYLSDRNGRLTIITRSTALLGEYRQGSGQARFQFCKQCGILVAVAYTDHEGVYAAVNCLALDKSPSRRHAVTPETLSGPDKVKRWKQFWFAHVVWN